MSVGFVAKHLKSDYGRFGRLLAASIALSLAAMWIVFLGIATETYRGEWQSAARFGSSITALLGVDIARNIEFYDLSLQAVADDVENSAVMALPTGLRRKVLYDHSANASGLGSIVFIDKTGKVVDDSRSAARPGLDLSDRDYFRAQRDGTVRTQPFISHPLTSRISHLPGIGLSRPVKAKDGSFAGVVIGMMTSSYFTHLFEAIQLPPESSIALITSDGTILMRAPLHETETGEVINTSAIKDLTNGPPSGHFLKRSVIDGVERLVSYRRIGDLPIYLTASLSTEAFLRPWRQRAIVIAAGFAVLSGIVLLLGFTLGRELRRRSFAERTLSTLAATDALTLLANRRRFDEMLDIEWRRAIRESMPLSLLMIDGDFFKSYNDTYGHVEGDHALRSVAEALKTCIDRPGDLAARFGGEEFAVLLPGADRDGAGKIAVSVRQAIAALAVPHEGSPLGILTVSIGAASRRPTLREPPSSLVEAADAALYSAKAAGRDRIGYDGDKGAVRFGWQRTRSPRVA